MVTILLQIGDFLVTYLDKTHFLHCPRDSEDLEITLLSGTFVPAKIKPNSKDKRTLGIAVRSIYLLR